MKHIWYAIPIKYMKTYEPFIHRSFTFTMMIHRICNRIPRIRIAIVRNGWIYLNQYICIDNMNIISISTLF